MARVNNQRMTVEIEGDFRRLFHRDALEQAVEDPQVVAGVRGDAAEC
jgi:hypothetical protein